jgi:ferredoxin-type protein NapF
MSTVSRRELLTGLRKGNKASALRPPYTGPESDFELCKSCHAPCVEACPEGVLLLDGEGIPVISFKRGGCSYCGECLKACPHGVMDPRNERIRAEVSIDPSTCSAWQGVLCFSCKEPCLDNAIKFTGLYKPVILADRCSACGYCVPLCPTGAIRVVPI